jgi:molybdopterin-containing oxidoreductase family iron-sulfur binding subunit
MTLAEHKWTMVIDMDRCTGCSACVVACHAENNVPITNAGQVAIGRAMHWIRIERYWETEEEHVRARFLPVLCQHCGRAPCEPVCPVYATYHSERQNLNVQAYNRCVGTRYCGNNDPYKVRFFNFEQPRFDEPLTQQLNPDVTVRSAGVMEKCTFCVQRIIRAEQVAKAEGRDLREGDVMPACVQTCPPSALMFGDLADPNGRIAEIIRGSKSRSFRLLGDLGTEPAIVYLKGGETNVGA